MDSFQTRGKSCPRIVFSTLTAVVTDCDFMQTSLIVFVVYWYFASLRIVCNHVVILPISMWTLPTRIEALIDFFFSSLLENWTSFPLTTYSQTDTKAFFLHDFIGFLFCLIYVLFKATSVLIFLLGSSVWEHCYKVCSSVNRGGIYFVHCKSATETSLDMAAVLFLYRRFRFLLGGLDGRWFAS